MQRRAVRIVIVVVLLALGIGAAVEAWGVQRQLARFEREHRELLNRIERLQGATTVIAAAQNAYIGAGHPDELSLHRVSVLVQQIATDTKDVRARIRAANSPSHLQVFADGLAALINADARARQDLADGQTLAAAEALFRGSRDPVAVMEAKLRELQYAETAAFDEEASRAAVRLAWMAGGIGVLWAVGLIVLAPVSSKPAVAPISITQVVAPVEETAAEAPAAEPTADPAVDLLAAADLCTAISRINDASALPALLERAAGILDAPGVIVWMGAGHELFSAAAYGYDPDTLERLGPIGRNADNATAVAWRTGDPRIVRADGEGTGAIVAPMWGPDGCIGVLTAEVRNGREGEPATQAVTSMIAAQLATVLPAWPAASVADKSESKRHAAAS